MQKMQWITQKIVSLEALIRQCNIWRQASQKIVFTNGCFDILHHGHLDYLTKAADCGNVLILGMNTDASVKKLKGDERPINNENDRALQLASLLFVDAVCLFEEDTPQSLIEALKPDVLVKGGDYSMEEIVGASFVKANGGSVEIIPFVEGYSTTGLLDRIRQF